MESKMNRIVTILAVFLFALSATASPLTPKQKQDVINKINAATSGLRTMSCTFTQTKYLSLLSDKMVSEGKMCYKQPDRLRWEYTSPYQYIFIFNGTKVYVGNKSRKDVIDTGSNKLFKEVARIMMSTVTGTALSNTADFSVKVEDGKTLTMRGQRNAARHGGVNGDLLIVIEEEKDPNLIRDENDLIYNLMLDFPTAVLGGSVDVPLVDGKARLKIPAGTQPGKVLRLRGKGLPQYGTSNRGDELVNVMVYVPENLTDDERKAIESLQGKPNVTPDQGTAHRIFSRLRHIFHRESQGDTQGN